MTRPEKWNWLHRDVDGMPLLDGPNCPDCGRRETITYGCSECEWRHETPGTYRWSWQGKAHAHIADDENEWTKIVMDHWQSHRGKCLITPT